MSKAILEFNLPEESTEFNAAVNGLDALSALTDIRNEVFRPARKHGYPQPVIQDLVEELGPKAGELIGHLEDLFQGILYESGLADLV